MKKIEPVIPDLTLQNRLHSKDLLCKVEDVARERTHYFKPSEIARVEYGVYEGEEGATYIEIDITGADTFVIKGMTPEVFFDLVDNEIIRINKLIANFQAKQMQQQQRFLEAPQPNATGNNGNKPPLKLV